MSPKVKKILNIVLDVVCAIILVFALVLAIFAISSKAKGYEDYTEVFGKAYVAVASESMDAEKPADVPENKPSGFKKGDLIAIKLISGEDTRKLEVGDIITFKYEINDNGKQVLNTHRIIEVHGEEGFANYYTTHGDNNPEGSNETVFLQDVVGVYEGKAPGIGHMFLFMNSSAGFFVCIVLPTILVVIYCAFNLFFVIRKEKKEQTVTEEQAKQEELDAERERIRAEIMAEMQAGQQEGEKPQAPPAPTEETQEVSSDESDNKD